jgi:Sulfotransferase family
MTERAPRTERAPTSAARESELQPGDPGAALRVVYIAGYGRSGTTVLDILLGQSPAVVGVGELAGLARHVWPGNEFCSCGQRVRECPFWSRVVRRWLGDKLALLPRYAALQKKMENLAAVATRSVGLALSKNEFAEYASLSRRLISAVSDEAGGAVVVDSSKVPGRALALSMIPALDLHVVHLVRDGRGVAWSLLKRFSRDLPAGIQKEIMPRSVFRTAVRWSAVNLATEWMCRRGSGKGSMRLRYEDLSEAPEAAIAKIESFLSLDYSDLRERLLHRELFSASHQLAGNRLRMQGPISVRPDTSWVTEMPPRKQRLFQVLCGPLQWRYGYI